MELPHRNEQLSGFKALGREGFRVLGLGVNLLKRIRCGLLFNSFPECKAASRSGLAPNFLVKVRSGSI